MSESKQAVMVESLPGEISSGSFRTNVLVLSLMTGVFLASHTALLTGAAVPRWDASSYFAPAQMLVADAAREGRLVLWNPWIGAGVPDAADPQTGTLSPVNVLLGALLGGSLGGFIAYWLLIWWLGGVAMFFLARHLGAPPWPAGLIALGFLASGFYIGHAQHTSFQLGYSFLPLIVWRFDLAITTGRRLPAVQAGALWGLAALSSYPALTILSGCFLPCWAVGRAGPRKTIAALLLLVVVGGIVMSPTWVAFFFEGKGYSDRTDPLRRELAVDSNAIHPKALTTWASPYVAVLGLTDPQLFQARGAYGASLYLPALIPILAVAGLLLLQDRSPRSRLWRASLALLGLLALACALGSVFPFRGWLYDLFLPLRFFRHSMIFRGYTLFIWCVLASLAARDLLATSNDGRSWKRFVMAAMAVVVAAIATLGLVGLTTETGGTHFRAAALIAAVLWIATASLLLCLHHPSHGKRPLAARLVLGLLVAVAALDAWSAIRMSRQFIVSEVKSALGNWQQTLESRSAHLQPVDVERGSRSRFGRKTNNRNIVAKEAVLESLVPNTNRYYLKWIRHPGLREAATGRERSWFIRAEAKELVPWSPAAFSHFVECFNLNNKMPFVLHRRHDLLRPDSRAGLAEPALPEELPVATPLAVQVVSSEPERLELLIEAPSDGYLMTTDRFARGWTARVNGVAATAHPANFIFRAVAAPEGQSRIVWTYTPAGHPWLLLLSWGTLLGAVLASVICLMRKQ
jgi:hypothetical protein